MANNYDFNINRFIRMLLPTFHRKPVFIAWMEALLAPVSRHQNEFTSFRSVSLYDVSITGQTIMLEKKLNDTFDFSQRRIFIQQDIVDANYLWFSSEGQAADYISFAAESAPKSEIFTQYKSEQGTITEEYSFIVKVPGELLTESEKIKSVVNQYKLAGKNFNIETI